MTKYFILLLSFFSMSLVGQSNSTTVDIVTVQKDELKGVDQIYVAVDKNAEFPGGLTALHRYIDEKLRDGLKVTCEYKISGTVFISFVVERDGSLSNIIILKSINKCPDCDTKSIAIVESMPKWTPAVHENIIVRSKCTIPIKFKFDR